VHIYADFVAAVQFTFSSAFFSGGLPISFRFFKNFRDANNLSEFRFRILEIVVSGGNEVSLTICWLVLGVIPFNLVVSICDSSESVPHLGPQLIRMPCRPNQDGA
jgi:hypothetical protein